jgi:nickel/cobalt exporter
MQRRILARLAVVAAAVGLALAAAPAAPASAHPLGNFSVNRYAGLTLHPDRVEAVVAADLAELPTLQDAAPTCAEAAEVLSVTVDGDALRWTVRDSSFSLVEGSAGLKTSRLRCLLDASVSVDRPVLVAVENRFRADRIGWRELVVSGSGIRIVDSPVPERSVSDELRAYPDDLLSSPVDVRSATFRAEPGPGSGPGSGSAGGGPDPAALGGGGSGATGLVAASERLLDRLVGRESLTPLVGALAVLLALVLGAAHAALPGHGKTVMAMYLAGRQGRPRDAVAVGATVTLTHTGGVLLLGLVLTTVAGVAGESILGWLGVASGALVTGVGAAALVSAVRRRRAAGAGGLLGAHRHTHIGAAPGHGHDHGHGHGGHGGHGDDHADGRDHGHENGHDHAHGHGHADGGHGHDQAKEHGHGHAHGRGHGHDHGHAHGQDHGHGHGHGESGGPGKWGIASIGIAGGLVPSPSALVVLLGAIALGRTGFGILLVVAYGLGMAATLTAAGLLLIRVRDRLARRRPSARRVGGWLAARWGRFAPPATAALIVVVGVGLVGRSLVALA